MADYKYEGSIPVIGGFIPANNNDFPLMHTHHVTNNNGERLDSLLAKIGGKTISININENQWEKNHRTGVWSINIKDEIKDMQNSYVASVFVDNDGTLGNAIVKTKKQIDNSISVYVDLPIKCKININGD